MRIVKTVIWVIVLVALAVFSFNNWEPVSVTIWAGLVLDTKLPVLVVASFLLGFLPVWALSKAGRWRLKRQISALRDAASAPSASISTTSLSEADPENPAN